MIVFIWVAVMIWSIIKIAMSRDIRSDVQEEPAGCVAGGV